MIWTKQSTARSLIIGPILDADGVAKTDEVVANINVTKNGSVGAGAGTLTHNHAGMYVYAAAAGDFDTLGVAQISLNSGTNAMAPVNIMVLPAVSYNALVADGALLKAIYAFARGKVVITGSNWAFYDSDNTTLLFTLTVATTGRTVA